MAGSEDERSCESPTSEELASSLASGRDRTSGKSLKLRKASRNPEVPCLIFKCIREFMILTTVIFLFYSDSPAVPLRASV